MRRVPWLGAAAIILLPIRVALGAPVTHTVVIEGMTFKPAVLAVKAGDTIVWRNSDLVPHTVTAPAARIESGEIVAEKSWRWRVAGPGTVDYVCRFHPMMRGKIVIVR